MVGKRFQGKTALITGGSRGIGRAIALRLAQEGARVVVNYVSNRDAAEEVRGRISAEGGECETIQADVADLAAVRKMVETALNHQGQIDVLVNNAAVVHHGSLLSYSDSDLEREFGEMWRVNVQGPTDCTRAVMPSMMSRKAGSIVNVASIAGYGNTSGGTTFYGATKAALIRLTKRFAFELGPYNINVNAVAPGLVRTDILPGARPLWKNRAPGKGFRESERAGAHRGTGRYRRRRCLSCLTGCQFCHRTDPDRRWGPHGLPEFFRLGERSPADVGPLGFAHGHPAPAGTDCSRWTLPLGHRTVISEIVPVSPSPKCTRASLDER